MTHGDGWRGLDRPVIKYGDSRGVGWRLIGCWGSWLIQTEKRGGGGHEETVFNMFAVFQVKT